MSDKIVLNKRVFNILLLGQTGAGKSTFVNSLANYLTYSDFASAIESNNPICLLPVKFTISRLTEGKEPIVVQLNGSNISDNNERHENAALSCTSDPRIYEFCGENVEYHIIDVPGIGDTGGTNVDQRNKFAILKKLENFSVLHGIFMLLNANQPKLTSEIKNNYNEILMEFHRNSTPIIMFVLTFSRTSDYSPGASMDPLRAYVSELAARDNPINIELNANTVFCVDNDGFRYQCGIKNPEFKEKFSTLHHAFKLSWDKSREAVFKMFQTMENNQGHLVSQSINVSKSRFMIKTLMAPLAKVCVMMENEMSAEMKEAQIKSLMETGNLINKQRIVQKLEHAQCVCISCAAKGQVAGSSGLQLEFKQICHNKCNLPGTVPDKFPDPKLADCAAFDRQGNCQICGCHFLKHVRITQKTMQRLINLPNKNVFTRQKAEQTYLNLSIELQKERSFIWITITKLSKYLRRNAIVDFNPLFKEKLENEIRIQHDARQNSTVLHSLQKRLDGFQLEMDAITYALQNTRLIENEEINVNTLADQLFGLDIYGSTIKNMYDIELSSPTTDQPDENIRFSINHIPTTQARV